jgi:hypothetical protein
LFSLLFFIAAATETIKKDTVDEVYELEIELSGCFLCDALNNCFEITQSGVAGRTECSPGCVLEGFYCWCDPDEICES